MSSMGGGEGSVGTVTVVLPRALLSLFPGAPSRVLIEGQTVGDILVSLDRHWPGMRDRLADSRPAIRRHLNIFVRGEKASLETLVAPGDVVYVLTAMSGG